MKYNIYPLTIKNFDERVIDITKMELEHIEESFCSLCSMLKTPMYQRLYLITRKPVSQTGTLIYDEYNAFVALSNKIESLMISIAECSDECDSLIKMFLDKGA